MNATEEIQEEEFPTYRFPGRPPPCSEGNNWRQALNIYLRKGQHREDAVYYENEMAVIIYDSFPKAQKHLLLLPKQLPGVKTPKDLRRGHLKTLREIHILAARVAAHLEKDGGSVKVGYHALPSMEPLHLHIMSSDMNSAFLKNRKHWNTFTTEFFRKPSDFETEIESSGHVFYDKAIFEALEKGPMACPKCGLTFSRHFPCCRGSDFFSQLHEGRQRPCCSLLKLSMNFFSYLINVNFTGKLVKFVYPDGRENAQ